MTNPNPAYKNLYDRQSGKPKWSSYAMRMHPKPTFYKYKWHIFQAGSPEGKHFFSTTKLSTHAAMTLMENLRRHNQGYLVYNYRYPRATDDSPLEMQHRKWCDIEKAPDFNLDTDPVWNGHK